MKLSKKVPLYSTILVLLIVTLSLFVAYETFNYLSKQLVSKEINVNPDTVLRLIATPMGVQVFVLRWDFYISYIGQIINDPFGIGEIKIEKNYEIVQVSNRFFVFKKVGEFVFGKEITPIVRLTKILGTTFFLTGLFVAFVTFLLSFYVSKRTLSRLEKFIAELDKFTGRNLDYRVQLKKEDDEIDELVEKFNDLMSRIEKSYKAQEEFVAAVSHELKTPVANLLGYVSLLKRWGIKNEEILKESVEAIAESAQEMKSVIEDMLLIAKVETLSKEKIELKSFIQEIAYNTFKEESFTLKGEGIFYTNREGLGIIISIIMKNALQHGAPPFEIELADSFVKITNNGPKIPDEELSKIFEKFYKGKSSEGSGLGLYIANEIAKKLQLKIEVSSTEEATSFIVYSPK